MDTESAHGFGNRNQSTTLGTPNPTTRDNRGEAISIHCTGPTIVIEVEEEIFPTSLDAPLKPRTKSIFFKRCENRFLANIYACVLILASPKNGFSVFPVFFFDTIFRDGLGPET